MQITIDRTRSIKEVSLTDCLIGLEDFMAVVRYGAELRFTGQFEETVNRSRVLVEKFLAEGRLIYGVTTGFGENVRYTIAPEDAVTLQKNIVRSHACAVGEPLDRESVRAILMMMILNCGKGQSGIRLETLELIRQFLNRDITPYAPGEGSVGYLGVEAHIAQALIGEGRILRDGKPVPVAGVLAEAGLSPVELQCKEGLSLLNGTITVTALGLLALYEAIVTLQNAEIAGALCFEALRGTVKALDPRIHGAKKHEDQGNAALNLRKLLEGSEIAANHIDDKVQDCYLLRAMPQIHGAAKKLVREAYEVIVAEMHSVSDNPEIFPEGEDDGTALMCGNFDGTFVGTHADMLAMAAAIAGNLSERSVDRMVNHKLNDGLPAFLVSNPGLNNGFMIPQYTAAGLVGEIKVLAHPSSIDSIPTCANQEDPVSLAYFAGKKAIQCMHKLQYIVAIELFTALQAVDFLEERQSPVLAAVHDFIREKVPFVDNDRFIAPDIEYLRELIREGTLVELVEARAGKLLF